MTNFTPREIVSELDRYIVGQQNAKRAVAIALRNRWRRQQVPAELRDEIAPKNIIMIGPTGVGKTEISRRLAKLANAPFLKVEATKFTEVGYVGRDVESIVRDLVVDRSSFDRIIEAGGYVSIRTGAAPDANEMPIPKGLADVAMDAAACIGCGACVAACPNASAMLFTAAKVRHLNMLPQGVPERDERVRHMVAQMDAEGFGACTNHFECEAACPKNISVSNIARANREFVRAMIKSPG